MTDSRPPRRSSQARSNASEPSPAPESASLPDQNPSAQTQPTQKLPENLADTLLESQVFMAAPAPAVQPAAPQPAAPSPAKSPVELPVEAPAEVISETPPPAAPTRPSRRAAVPLPPTGPENFDEPVDLIDELKPMYSSAAPFLARFLPQSEPVYQGLRSPYCDLHTFLKYLHDQSWHGYLHAALGDQSAYVLVYEGRTVSAAATGATGEQALGEMLNLYEQGAELTGYPLTATLAHVLSGVGSRAWKFNLTEDFTGLHARPSGAIFYARGEIVATMTATLPYEGAFPAPLRPQALILPRSLAGWAHHTYNPTLRGRDAINAITDVYPAFKAKYGPLGQGLMRAIVQNQTPAEYAMREDVALHEIEPLLQDFLKTGYLRDS